MSAESFNTNWREYVKEAQANTPGAGNVLAQVDSCYGRIKEAKELPEEMKKDDKGEESKSDEKKVDEKPKSDKKESPKKAEKDSGKSESPKQVEEELEGDKGYVEPEMEMGEEIDPELDALVDSASMEEGMEEDVSLEDVAALAQILESMEGEDAMDIAQALSEEDDILQGLI